MFHCSCFAVICSWILAHVRYSTLASTTNYSHHETISLSYNKCFRATDTNFVEWVRPWTTMFSYKWIWVNTPVSALSIALCYIVLIWRYIRRFTVRYTRCQTKVSVWLTSLPSSCKMKNTIEVSVDLFTMISKHLLELYLGCNN